MSTGPSNLGNQSPTNLGYDGRYAVVHLGEPEVRNPEPYQVPPLQGWRQREAREMRQARRLILGAALRWALLAAVPGALLGLGLDYLLGAAAQQWHSDWTAPHVLVSLTLGALGGALGAALAGVLAHWVFEEHKDIPVVGGGVATCGVIGGGIYGAGLGGTGATLAGIALGIPTGLAGGLGVFFVYWTAKVALRAIRKEVRGDYS